MLYNLNVDIINLKTKNSILLIYRELMNDFDNYTITWLSIKLPKILKRKKVTL